MGVSSEVATAVAEKAVPSKSLKIKILAKKPGLYQNLEQVAEVNNMTKKLVVVGAKRKPEASLDGQKEKRSKMDRKSTSHCLNILTKLMRNKLSIPFLEPVNPIKWAIPDYFDIIKHPMDLGTIKAKLQQNSYSGAEEFEADVRLTFSNAMLYNPPGNWVHQHAKILSGEFDGLWKSVRTVLFRDQQNIEKGANNRLLQSYLCHVDTLPHSDSAGPVSHWKKESVCLGSAEESVRPGFAEESVRAGSANESVRAGSANESVCHVSEKVSARPVPARESARPVPARESAHRVPARESVCPVAAKESVHPLSASVNREYPNRACAEEVNAVEVQKTCSLQQSRSDQDSEVSCVDEEHACASIRATAGSVSTRTIRLESVLDIQLSPSKALRAAKLKSRFAETIIKAQNKLQPVKGGAYDGTFLQEEKEKLERQQQAEKARIEAQVRAAEEAARLIAEGELKKQRELARATLEKMERSTDLDDNFHTLKELETLIGSSLFVVCHSSKSCRGQNQVGSNKLGSPLERLGLYIKAEYRVGDDDDEVLLQERDVEEGEV